MKKIATKIHKETQRKIINLCNLCNLWFHFFWLRPQAAIGNFVANKLRMF